MKLKKIAALVLSSMMVLSLVACGGKNATESTKTDTNTEAQTDATTDTTTDTSTDTTTDAATDDGTGILKPNSDPANTKTTDETLRIGLASEPSTLWGAAGGKTENEEQIINSALLDRLVDVDPATNEVKPSLATKWEWIDDKHCKFTLRDDVIMSDGTPLVAEDVVYTVNLWAANDASNDTGRFMVGAKADDEHTVTIEYNVVAPGMLSMMAWGNFGIVSEAEVTAAGGLEGVQKNPVIGSGKYKFKEWKSGQSITLERNDNYWNKDYKGYYKEIVFTFTGDAAAREMAVESGDSDVAYDMPVSQAATFAKSPSVSTIIYSFGQVAHLWYNMGEKAGATKDLKVRQAIDKALDFDAIASVGTAGFGQAALAYMDPGCSYYSESYTKEERAVDKEGAKALLTEAGYADGLELTALCLQDAVPVFTVIQANLAEVGIKLTINTPDTAQFVQGAFGGDYDIIMVGDNLVTRTPSIVPFLTKVNVNGPGMVIGGPKYTTDEIDAAIATLISEADDSKLVDEAHKIDVMIKDQTICSNTYSEMKATITAKDLKGFGTRERGYIDVTTLYK